MFWDEQKYIPTLEDIEWMANVLRLMNENGLIVFPTTKLVYRVNHQEHTLTLMNEEILQEETARVTHLRTIEVAKIVGYNVKVKE